MPGSLFILHLSGLLPLSLIPVSHGLFGHTSHRIVNQPITYIPMAKEAVTLEAAPFPSLLIPVGYYLTLSTMGLSSLFCNNSVF
jgi:hypothetical protein